MNHLNHPLLGSDSHILYKSDKEINTLTAGLMGRDIARNILEEMKPFEVGESQNLFLANCSRKFSAYKTTAEYADIESVISSFGDNQEARDNFSSKLYGTFDKVMKSEFKLSTKNELTKSNPTNDQQNDFS